MKLSKPNKQNFATLQRAFKHDDVALVDVRRKSDGHSVPAICIVQPHPEPSMPGEMLITPFAVMVEGNPYESFDPPSPHDAGYLQADEEGSEGETSGSNEHSEDLH